MNIRIDMEFDAVLDYNSLLKKFNLEPNGKVQEAIDRSCIEWCRMYAPWRTGDLAMNPDYETEIGSGVIRYKVPYGRRVYYNPDNMQFSTEVNALAGSHWFERAMADHAQDVLREAKKATGG